MMRSLVLSGKRIVTGRGSMEYLKGLPYKKAVIVTGGSSMIKGGFVKKAEEYLSEAGCRSELISGIRKNPSFEEVFDGVRRLKEIRPDVVIALGGGSAMDAAKGMLLFYEFPNLTRENVLAENAAGKIPAERKTGLICIPSTSGTGSELTRGTVLTDVKQQLKVPIMTDCLRPDIAILDAEVTMSMPDHVAAETGMDALTHAVEAYTNHNLDDFDAGLAETAIRGIFRYLPKSVHEKSALSREKVHNYQAMAGISFANVGLGMVHGIAHSFGAAFDMAHGLTNAVILPYVLTYNRRDVTVEKKLQDLAYLCRVPDFVDAVLKLRMDLDIPESFQKAGITEEQYKEKHDLLLCHAMLGATKVNPVPMTKEAMRRMIDAVYYGREIDF